MVNVPVSGLPGTKNERTFIAVKPDGVQRGKVGGIISRFEDKGFKLVAMKVTQPSLAKAEGHYADLAKKPFFGGLCKYFSSGPICAMVWEGLGVIKTGRVLLGETNPAQSLPGSIRGDLCIDIGRNICHGSDCAEGAEKEVAYWFGENEVCNWTPANQGWVYEKSDAIDNAGPNPDQKSNGDKDGMEGKYGSNTERTFIAIKPDGVQRGKIGNIISRFEDKGFKIAAMKFTWPSLQKAEGHYADLSKKPFFGGLCKYFSSGPICAMVWEGKGSVLTGRALLGATNPAESLPGTIRGDLCIDIGRNVCHGSDGAEGAKNEIGYWFNKDEMCDWTPANQKWVYEG